MQFQRDLLLFLYNWSCDVGEVNNIKWRWLKNVFCESLASWILKRTKQQQQQQTSKHFASLLFCFVFGSWKEIFTLKIKKIPAAFIFVRDGNNPPYDPRSQSSAALLFWLLPPHYNSSRCLVGVFTLCLTDTVVGFTQPQHCSIDCFYSERAPTVVGSRASNRKRSHKGTVIFLRQVGTSR